MEIIESMDYIRHWSKELLSICNTFELAMNSWDQHLPEEHLDKHSSKIDSLENNPFNNGLTLLELLSVVIAANYEPSKYYYTNIKVTDEAKKLITSFKIYSKFLETNVNSVLSYETGFSVISLVRETKALAEISLKLSTLPNDSL